MLYTRNAKSPRTCSHGYCRGHLFWVGKILKRGGCGEGPRRAQRKARNRPSPSLLDEKAQKLTADFGAGEHECLEDLNGWNGIHCRNLSSKPQGTQRVTEGCYTPGNAKSPRTCSLGYCRGYLFWLTKS